MFEIVAVICFTLVTIVGIIAIMLMVISANKNRQ